MVPIPTQILEIIGLRLNNIKEVNEYFTTVETLEKARITPFKEREMPAINYYYTTDSLTEVNGSSSSTLKSKIRPYLFSSVS